MHEKLFDHNFRGQERKSFDVETIVMAADIFPRRSNHFPNSVLSRIHFVFCQGYILYFVKYLYFVKDTFCTLTSICILSRMHFMGMWSWVKSPLGRVSIKELECYFFISFLSNRLWYCGSGEKCLKAN